MYRAALLVGIVASLLSCNSNLQSYDQVTGDSPTLRVVTKASSPMVQGTGNEYFVSPKGRPGAKGNKKKPWDLATALAASNRVQPGDTIWLRGGIYSGSFVSDLRGTPEAPIVVRQFSDERATIDGDITLEGQYTILWGFEVRNSNPVPPEVMAINNRCPGSKIINLIIHDSSGNGIGTWEQAPDSEVYGCILQYCGVQGSSPGRHAHGIYVQNVTGSKAIVDNVIIDSYGYGIHEYASSASLNGITLEGNIAARSGYGDIIIQGGRSMGNPVVKDNLTYRSDGNLGARFDAGSNSATVTATGNTLVGGVQCWNFPNVVFNHNLLVQRTQLVELIMPPGVSPTAYSWDQNVYKQISGTSASIAFVVDSGSGNHTFDFNAWRSTFGRDENGTYEGIGPPTGTTVFIRPNKYEPGRANIAVYNWDHNKKVSIDVSSLLSVGAEYELRNAQDFFGPPILSGTYDGNPLRVQMSQTGVARPVGSDAAPEPLGPEFGVFVLVKL